MSFKPYIKPEVTERDGYEVGDSDFIPGSATYFQVLSDVHLEMGFTGKLDKVPKFSTHVPTSGHYEAEYLLLAGDIGNPQLPEYGEFLASMSIKYKGVYVIPGNHEYYGQEMGKCNDLMAKTCEKSSVQFMLRSSILLPNNIRLLGTTLWFHSPEGQQPPLNDFNKIKLQDHLVTPHDINVLHSNEVEWLVSEIERAKEHHEHLIIMTHHMPTEDGSGIGWATEIGALGDPVIAWVCGHTHSSFCFTKHGTMVASNQWGYLNFGENDCGGRGEVMVGIDDKGRCRVFGSSILKPVIETTLQEGDKCEVV